MSGPYEVLNARVKQKVATEAEWLATEDDFGVIFAGEQAFVVDDAGTMVNFKIGDGTKKFSELPYFIAYYSNALNQKILSFLNQNIDLTIGSTFRNFSCLYDIILINNSGSDIDLKVGTTSGANDLMEIVVPDGVYQINLRKVFQDVTTLYISGLAGKNYSLILVYFQYDESPATPPTSGGAAFRWPKEFKGMYEPLTDTSLDDNWDFTTGRGKAGTVWENCAISGTNGTEDMSRFYPVGYQVGGSDSLRPATTFGNASGEATLTENNIPTIQLKIASAGSPGSNLSPGGEGSTIAWSSAHTSGNQDYDLKKGPAGVPTLGVTSKFGKNVPDPIDVRPKSKIVLFFVAISD